MSSQSNKTKLTYAQAGVDIHAGDEAVARIKKLAKATFGPEVLSEIGSFGGFFQPNLSGFKQPVLISSADGVGTKLKIAFMTGQHTTIGEDLVNHCVNDILVHGARGLFFLDYIATGRLDPNVVADVVEGLSRGCRNNGMALIGGETAEMPGFYQDGEYDLAGFIVGIVDKERVINGSTIVEGDVCIGLPSSGLHTNGYSLARKVFFEVGHHKPDDVVDELGGSVAEALLAIHRPYTMPVFTLLKEVDIHGMAHITGGGIPGNLNRVLPKNLDAVIARDGWPVPSLYGYMRKIGDLDPEDMYSAFNMGIGYVLVVPKAQYETAMGILAGLGETSYQIGQIEKGRGQVRLV